jgi:hypothetical protein
VTPMKGCHGVPHHGHLIYVLFSGPLFYQMPQLRQRHPPHVQRHLKHLVQQRKLGMGPPFRHKSASVQRLRNFGRTFTDGFSPILLRNGNAVVRVNIDHAKYESPLGLTFSIARPTGKRVRKKKAVIQTAQLKLGFEKDSVVVEAINGLVEDPTTMRRLNEMLGEPWPNCGLRIIEERARKLGFRSVVIRDPRTNYWYETPYEWSIEYGHTVISDPIRKKQIQDRMKQFYALIAKKNGYRRIEGNYVKILE